MDRIWIELERPKDEKHADQICAKANKVLEKLGVISRFNWSPRKAMYMFGDVSFTYLSDNGQWLNLDYISLSKEEQEQG